MKHYIQKISLVHKKIADPFNAKAYIDLELFVPKPTKDNPLPCILISIRNGHSKLFFRLQDVREFTKAFSLSKREKERLKQGLISANAEADEIEKDILVQLARRKLKPGGQIVRTDTGEVIAEAERILKGE